MANANFELDPLLGKKAKDKVTGFEGIIVTKLICLFGCAQYGLTPPVDDKGKKYDTQYFDEGRLEITGEGIQPSDVQAESPGCDFNSDAPR